MTDPMVADAPQDIVVFDCDDVLNFLGPAVSAAMARRGNHVPVDQWSTYDWTKVFGADAPALQQVLRDDHLLETAAPDPSGLSAIRLALDAGLKVHVWTARGWHEDGQAITEQFLHDFVGEGIVVRLSELGQAKASLAQPGERVVLYFDDSPQQVETMLAAFPGCSAWVVDRAWNRAATTMPRTSSPVDVVTQRLASM